MIKKAKNRKTYQFTKQLMDLSHCYINSATIYAYNINIFSYFEEKDQSEVKENVNEIRKNANPKMHNYNLIITVTKINIFICSLNRN